MSLPTGAVAVKGFGLGDLRHVIDPSVLDSWTCEVGRDGRQCCDDAHSIS